MLGAIIGDIVGSIYEFRPKKSKEFPLFSDRPGRRSHFTDDTVMTIAVSSGLIDGGTPDAFIDALKELGAAYPKAGYGHKFRKWLASDDREPYNSWGNGSAMRVSPCAWYASSLEDAERLAEVSAAVTHNHPEGIKGAKAVAAAIFLARTGANKSEIRDYVETNYGYNLHRTLAEIRPKYKFDSSCRGSVPEAIIAFLESTDFEDAIRNAVSLGGDADTQAAIAGSIAEAAYGIPPEIAKEASKYLLADFVSFINHWVNNSQKGNKLSSLTRCRKSLFVLTFMHNDIGLLVAIAITFFAGGISYDYYYDADYLYFAPMLLFPLFALFSYAICVPVNKYRRTHRKHTVLNALHHRAQYLGVHQNWLAKDGAGKRDFTRYSSEPLSSLPSVDWVHNNQQLATHQKEVSNIIAQVKKGQFPDILELKFIEPVPVVPKFDTCIGGPNTKSAITQITLEDLN